MAEAAVPEDSTTPEDENLDAERGDVADTSWALLGALIGAIAGSAAGAGLGMLLARRPEALAQARSAIGGSGRHVARAAALAAGEVMTSRHLNQLLKAESDAERGEMMKQAAREAGFAAATAARDTIISLRRDAVGSGSQEVVEEGGAGSKKR